MPDRRKRILNLAEKETAEELEPVVDEHDCLVYKKVRVADVLDIQHSGLSNEEYGYAFKAHFDFVIARRQDTQALFAVEYDGPLHSSEREVQHRDRLKDGICDKLGLPLLRVDSEFVYQEVGRFRLLPLFIEVWFLGEAFYEQQAEGRIPTDEDFDPYSVIDVAGRRIIRKYDPAQQSRDQLHRYHEQGITRTLNPVLLRGQDPSGKYAVCLAVSYVRDGPLSATGCFRTVNFGYFLPGDIAEDIATIDLARKIPLHMKGVIKTSSYQEVADEFERWDFGEWRIKKDHHGLPSFVWTNKPDNPGAQPSGGR